MDDETSVKQHRAGEREITNFFARGKSPNTRNVVAYTRHGDFIEVKLISNSKPIDVRTFKLNDENGNAEFFQYVVEKLGFDYKKYKRERDIEWQ